MLTTFAYLVCCENSFPLSTGTTVTIMQWVATTVQVLTWIGLPQVPVVWWNVLLCVSLLVAVCIVVPLRFEYRRLDLLAAQQLVKLRHPDPIPLYGTAS